MAKTAQKENFIGELLKAKRRIRNWSQEHVAEKLDLSQQQYQKYEAGKLIPPMYVLEKLSTIFEIAIDDFFKKDLKAHNTLSDVNKILEDEVIRDGSTNKEGKEVLRAYMKYETELKGIEVPRLLAKLAKLSKEERDIIVRFILK
jgi:transcriptional regulator with XRE-family HTH domain